jgi:hypothetical protein
VAYEAVPIDVELQKVTAAERDALARYKIHENINTFLGNENTPILLGAVGVLAVTPFLLDLFRKAVEDTGCILTDKNWEEVKTGYKASLLGPAGLSTYLAQKVVGEKRLSDYL